MKCEKCGSETKYDLKVCPKCYEVLKTTAEEITETSKIIKNSEIKEKINNQEIETQTQMQSNKNIILGDPSVYIKGNQASLISFWVSIFSCLLFLSFFSFFSLPIAIMSLFFGIKGWNSEKRKFSYIGVFLSSWLMLLHLILYLLPFFYK